MTETQPGLPPEVDLDELDALLCACPDENHAMLMSELDGYLAGVIVSQRAIPQDRWLPEVWGGSAQAFSDDPDRSARLSELILARKDEITNELLLGGLAYRPVYDVDTDNTVLWEIWAEGFARAMAVSPQHWDKLLQSRDADLRAAASGLALFVAHATNVPLEDSIPFDIESEAPETLPYLVETLFRRQHGMRRVVLADGPAATSPKIGRNAPCPCGSGKKFKKCCGG